MRQRKIFEMRTKSTGDDVECEKSTCFEYGGDCGTYERAGIDGKEVLCFNERATFITSCIDKNIADN
jgi:hypothetical protein